MVHLLSVKLTRSSALSMEVSYSVRYVAATDGSRGGPKTPLPPPILGKKEEITEGGKTDMASKTKPPLCSVKYVEYLHTLTAPIQEQSCPASPTILVLLKKLMARAKANVFESQLFEYAKA